MASFGRTRISIRSFALVTLICAMCFVLILRSQVQDHKVGGGEVHDKGTLKRRHVASVASAKQGSEITESNQDEEEEEVKPTIDPEILIAMKELEIRLRDRNNYKQKPKSKISSGDMNLFSQSKRNSKPRTEREILERLDKILQHQAVVCPQILPISPQSQKVLIVAGEGVGYGVISNAFGNRNGVFTHSDPLDELLLDENPDSDKNVAKLLFRLETLMNCDIQPETFDLLKKYQAKTIQRNEFVRDACKMTKAGEDLEDLCLTSSKVLMKTCSKFPLKIFSSSLMTMPTVAKLMKRDSSLNVLYLFRDPRAVIHSRFEGSTKFDFSESSQNLCKKFESDLQVIEQIRRTDLASRIHFLRYEDLALQPEVELTKLVETLSTENFNPPQPIHFCSSEETEGSKSKWRFDKNPAEQINSWKQMLPIESINAIEEECLDVLSQLEYPIIGKVD